jgi:hypothetical protein
MHIDLEKAYRDGGSFEARLPAATLEWEGGDPIETGPSLLKGRLTRVRRGFDLDADLASRFTLKCVRCLEFYSIELSFPFHLLFVSKDAEAGEGHDHQLQDADCDLYPCAGGKVDPSDLARMVEALRLGRDLCRSPELAALVGPLLVDEAILDDDHAITELLRSQVTTTYHPAGTAPMGSIDDERAVVDAHGRVHGIEDLRVVDASIMPTSVRCNTHLTCVMLAERIASWMRDGD